MVSSDGLCSISTGFSTFLFMGASRQIRQEKDILLAHRSSGEPDFWTPAPTPFFIQEGA
jgi:hypothetical protein